jgi:uncharacterized membrane protein YqjE
VSAGQPGPDPSAQEQRSLGDIAGDVVEDLGTLVKQELELARTELKQEVAKAGKGAGMLGGAGVAGLLCLTFLSLTLTFLLDNWMPLEIAALIVTAVWAAVAGVLAARGRSELKRSNPQLPKTQQTLKEDATWVRAQKS